jgi:hypothetical protein
MNYYNEVRTHLSLGKDAPVSRVVHAVGRILPRPILGGPPPVRPDLICGTDTYRLIGRQCSSTPSCVQKNRKTLSMTYDLFRSRTFLPPAPQRRRLDASTSPFSVSAPSLPWLHRTIWVPNPKDRVHEQRSVKGKTSGHGYAKARNAEIKPIHGCEPCT